MPAKRIRFSKGVTADQVRAWYEDWYIGQSWSCAMISRQLAEDGLEFTATTIKKNFAKLKLRVRNASQEQRAKKLVGQKWEWPAEKEEEAEPVAEAAAADAAATWDEEITAGYAQYDAAGYAEEAAGGDEEEAEGESGVKQLHFHLDLTLPPHVPEMTDPRWRDLYACAAGLQAAGVPVRVVIRTNVHVG